jgi:hypothetical protein
MSPKPAIQPGSQYWGTEDVLLPKRKAKKDKAAEHAKKIKPPKGKNYGPEL